MRSSIIFLVAAAGCAGPTSPADLPPASPDFAADSVARFVDPFIGTANEGNTFPGAVLPWGMTSPSPHNRISTPLDYLGGRSISPSGYVDGEPAIKGFGLTHLSGAGCPDLGAPVIAATTGELATEPDGYASAYSNERAWPGYYAVHLTDYSIRADMTATRRTGSLRFEFPGGRKGDANVLVDAGQALAWRAGNGAIRIKSPTEIEGSTETGLFCAARNRQRVYFAIRLDRPAEVMGTWTDGAIGAATEAQGKAGAWLRFSTAERRVVEVRVAVSFVSVANAWENLMREGGGTFDEQRAAALATWEEALGRIRVSDEDAARSKMFYTALYHTLIHPSLASDTNGDHPRFGGGVEVGDPVERYHVHSLWDTYRGVHPLFALLYPEMQARFLRGLAAMTVEGGAPPRWELAGNETDIMVGDPALVVIGDGLAKGLVDFDLAPAFEAMRAAALDVDSKDLHRPGNKSYRALGYVPIEEGDSVWGPVSTTLEYALADYNLANIADSLGKKADAALFRAQSGSWANLFDSQTGFLRPRRADGTWLSPFNPDALTGSNGQYRNSGGPGYVEGTAWHYNFFVPHDIPGLIAKLGGEAAFAERLQSMFAGGKFVMWNEPDIGFPYLFTYTNDREATAQAAIAGAARSFGTGRDGLPGNDDAGALSAWYVWSAMGLYPDAPGTTRYSLGRPLFRRVELRLRPGFHAGTQLVIDAGAAPEGPARATFDGKPLPGPAVDHARLTAGGTLAFGPP